MVFARSVRMFAAFGLVTAPLLMGNKGCGESHSGPRDAGDQGGNNTCAPKDCEGMPVPEIACADGPTNVVCERGSDDKCHPSIRCGESDGGAALGGTCGGIAALTCASGLFCDLETMTGGTGCQGVADASGVCAKKPDACPELYAPVCGCNLRSYSSPCEAHASGASVLHDGLCTAEECEKAGGRAVYSDGASIPMCKSGEDSFRIPGIEPAKCCLPGTTATTDLRWYETCGNPVCGTSPTPSGLPACTTQKQGASCSAADLQCDLFDNCGKHLICASTDPKLGAAGCPRSRRDAKVDIRYLDENELAQKHDESDAPGDRDIHL